jgi:protein involved in polysaccharide export with SLBB domain
MMRIARKNAFRLASLAAFLLMLGGLTTSCFAQDTSLPGPSALSRAAAPQSTPFVAVQQGQAAPITDERYRLGTGDKLRINVYGEEDLSGEFLVDGSGQVQLPLIGNVKAAGLTLHEFIVEVATALKEGYLKDPKVSAEVLNYRPFYIMGEVNKPGEYPYENGLNVLGAIALAGGFTYRANDNDVYIRRAGSKDEESMPADSSTRIYPGDIIRVAERIF